MGRVDAVHRERCECGAETEIGAHYLDAQPVAIYRWRIHHARGCDLMFNCLPAAEQGEARPNEAS